MSDERERSASPDVSPRLEAAVDLVGGIAGRLRRVWRALPGERRLAAGAALGLFVTLFLPWYQVTVIARGVTDLRSLSDSMTGWGAFSFVEAAVLLVAAAVLALLFVRAEGRAFHIPGGDGTIITVAGAWTCLLIVWRMFDKQGTTGHGLYSTSSGIEWGIFVALAVAGLLTYAGTRVRAAHETEPPLPGEAPSRGRGRRSRRGAQAAPEAPAAPRELWPVAESEVEETWLALEQDMPRRSAPPPRADDPAPTARTAPADDPARPRAADVTAPLAEAEPTEALPAPDVTTPLSAAAPPTIELPPSSAAPTPRRRRPRSLANPPAGDSLASRGRRDS